jgi:hypothetical protein
MIDHLNEARPANERVPDLAGIKLLIGVSFTGARGGLRWKASDVETGAAIGESFADTTRHNKRPSATNRLVSRGLGRGT